MRRGVLLHGRGRTADEMLQLAAQLNTPNIEWAAPAAENGRWYPHRFMEPLSLNEPFLSHAVAQCDEAISGASDAVLVGFSQGGCLATEYLLRHPGRCATVIVLTGGLIGPAGTRWVARKSLAGTRVLITGSDIDEWVPEQRIRETASVLAELGADVTLRVYKGRAHIVSVEEIAEARAFIPQD